MSGSGPPHANHKGELDPRTEGSFQTDICITRSCTRTRLAAHMSMGASDPHITRYIHHTSVYTDFKNMPNPSRLFRASLQRHTRPRLTSAPKRPMSSSPPSPHLVFYREFIPAMIPIFLLGSGIYVVRVNHSCTSSILLHSFIIVTIHSPFNSPKPTWHMINMHSRHVRG